MPLKAQAACMAEADLPASSYSGSHSPQLSSIRFLLQSRSHTIELRPPTKLVVHHQEKSGGPPTAPDQIQGFAEEPKHVLVMSSHWGHLLSPPHMVATSPPEQVQVGPRNCWEVLQEEDFQARHQWQRGLQGHSPIPRPSQRY